MEHNGRNSGVKCICRSYAKFEFDTRFSKKGSNVRLYCKKCKRSTVWYSFIGLKDAKSRIISEWETQKEPYVISGSVGSRSIIRSRWDYSITGLVKGLGAISPKAKKKYFSPKPLNNMPIKRKRTLVNKLKKFYSNKIIYLK